MGHVLYNSPLSWKNTKVEFWLFTTDGYRYQAEAAQTAVRLIRDDAVSVSCTADQIRIIRSSRYV